jgi:hypothetical protein
MRRLLMTFVLAGFVSLVSAGLAQAADAPRVPAKGTEGPDIRRTVPVKSTEGPDIRDALAFRVHEGLWTR